MINAILAYSATTPAVMFTFLLSKFNLQQDNKGTYLAYRTGKKPISRLDQFFEKHFERLIAV